MLRGGPSVFTLQCRLHPTRQSDGPALTRGRRPASAASRESKPDLLDGLSGSRDYSELMAGFQSADGRTFNIDQGFIINFKHCGSDYTGQFFEAVYVKNILILMNENLIPASTVLRLVLNMLAFETFISLPINFVHFS